MKKCTSVDYRVARGPRGRISVGVGASTWGAGGVWGAPSPRAAQSQYEAKVAQGRDDLEGAVEPQATEDARGLPRFRVAQRLVLRNRGQLERQPL